VVSARAGRGVVLSEVRAERGGGPGGFPPACPRRACVGAAGAQQATAIAAVGVEASLLATAEARPPFAAIGCMRPPRPGTATSSSTCWPDGMSTPAPASSSLQSASIAKTSLGALRCCALPVAVGKSSTWREKTSTMRLPKARSLEEVAAAEVTEEEDEEEAVAAQGASEKAAVLHRAASTASAPVRTATATPRDGFAKLV
jgi:hypothetical protein